MLFAVSDTIILILIFTKLVWQIMFNHTVPDPWMYELTDLMQLEWSHIMLKGHPEFEWYHFDKKEPMSLHITNDDQNILKKNINGMDPILDFWINDYFHSNDISLSISSIFLVLSFFFY